VLLLLGISWATGLASDDFFQEIATAEAHRSVTPELVASLDGPPPVAARAALALGRTEQPAAVAPLRAHREVADAPVRAMVFYALGLLADAPTLDPALQAAKADPNSAVRYAAVDAVGRILAAAPVSATHAVALDLFAVAAGDTNAAVRAHALVQFDAFRTRPFAADVAAGLERFVGSSDEAEIRRHAAWMVARSYARMVDPQALAAQLHDRDEIVRLEAVRAVGVRGGSGAAALDRPLVADRSWRVQFEALEALRRIAGQPRSEHLTADPPGLHLPPFPGPAPGAQPRASAPPVAHPPPPDPSRFPPSVPLLPLTGSEMNGPLPGPHPRVTIATSKGDVVLRLYPEWAPGTVANFLSLARYGYFDGNRWFRIVPDFVVQTGDRTNKGDGGPGYTIGAEENPIEQRPGVIAMGLDYASGKPERDSAGSQFYITLSPQYHLDRSFSVFGEVESGFDVLANLVESDTILTVVQIADD